MTTPLPTLAEIWQGYALAPSDHATLSRLDGVASHARVVNDGGMSRETSLQNWLAVALHDARGNLTGLAHFPPSHGQRLEYLPQDYPTGAQVINKPQQGGDVVYIVASPKEGYKIAHAGLPCVIAFTPDLWNGKDRPTPKTGGNLVHVVEDWLNAGYRVAVPVALHEVSLYAEWFIGIDAILLPMDMTLAAYDPDELKTLLPDAWQAHQPTAPAWTEPLPLDDSDKPLPFPLEALPKDLQNLMREMEGYYKTPIPLIAGSALSVLAVAGQSLANINIDGTLESPLSLFTMVIAESGERKSQIDKELSKPVHEWERNKQREMQEEATKAKAAQKAWAAKIKGLEQAIQNAERKRGATATLEKTLLDLQQDEPQDVVIPSLLMQDQTPEGMTKALHRYPTAGLLSSEAGIVLGGHGMSSDTAMRNMSIFNDLWSGHPIKITRAQSENYSLYKRRLSVGLAVQPTTLAAFSKNTDARGIGLFSRFLLSHPESTRGQRMYTPPPEWTYLPAYKARITKLLDMQREPETDGGGLDLHTLDLHSKALTVWIDGYNAIEQGLQPHREYASIPDIASKTADNAARLAGLFHLYEHGLTGRVTELEMQSGITIASWYLNEALRYFTNATKPANIQDAINLEKWIVSKCKEGQTNIIEKRELMQKVTPKSLRKAATFTAAVDLLKLHNRVRLEKHNGKESIIVNPALLPIQQQVAA